MVKADTTKVLMITQNCSIPIVLFLDFIITWKTALDTQTTATVTCLLNSSKFTRGPLWNVG